MDCFWSGKHWVHAASLYLPVVEGGQGLINIQAKIASFRLQTALCDSGLGRLDTARLLLRRAGRLGYDKQLFLLSSVNVDHAGLTPFYSSVLQVWQIFTITCVTDETPGMWLFEEPLFYNDFTKTRTLQSTKPMSLSQTSRLHQIGPSDEDDGIFCGHAKREEQHHFCQADQQSGG